MNKSLLAYYRGQQSSQQWEDFLRCMAVELASQASEEELRAVFSGIGKRQASALENHLHGIDGLNDLELALNEYWARRHWGFVAFNEKKNVVEIMHSASPLAEVFGEDSLSWSVGFLEGFYEQIFLSLGAGRRMRVSALESEESGLNLFFELAE